MHQLSYKEKIFLCKPWFSEIISEVKKDLKQEHIPKDKNFCQRRFLGKSFNQITKQELAEGYFKEVESGNDALAQFICTRWLLKHTDIYAFFENILKKISDDFDALAEIEETLEEKLKKESVEKFGVVKIFIFSLFNSVVFREKIFLDLQMRAHAKIEEENEVSEKLAFDQMQQQYERKILALKDKYEKKLSGFQIKYLNDTKKLQEEIVRLKGNSG